MFVKGDKRAGRPKGKVSKETELRRKTEQQVKNKILWAAHKLINSQMNLARGCQFLYKIETKIEGGREVKGKPVLVTDPEEIYKYLAGQCDEKKSTYYYITTEKPDGKAIDSMFDRVFGKAVQAVELDNKDDEPFEVSVDVKEATTTQLKEMIKSLIDKS